MNIVFRGEILTEHIVFKGGIHIMNIVFRGDILTEQ